MTKLLLHVLLLAVICSALPVVSTAAEKTILYVAGDGTGDFNCDGSDDQVEINAALDQAAADPLITTVYLKGPFTYNISDTVFISSDTILTGDSTAVLKLADRVNWTAEQAMISNKNFRGFGDKNIEIYGFELNGNREGNPQISSGKGYHQLIYMKLAFNVSIHDMYMHNNHGDGLKYHTGDNLLFYNNTIDRLGHDGLYALRSTNIEAYNNRITCRTNSALRAYNSNHVSFHDNIIDSRGEGGAGIEIQKEGLSFMDHIEIYNNTIYNTNYAGIWVFGSGAYDKSQTVNLHIHHNKIYDTGLNRSGHWVGGVVLNGFHNALIEHNVFDGVYGSAVAVKTVYSQPAPVADYVLYARNNIIVNTRPHAAGGAGIAFYNGHPEHYAMVTQNNLLYNNPGGNYYNTSSTDDIVGDPLFADAKNRDYHLKSRGGRWTGSEWVIDSDHSPGIDAGYHASPFELEPEPNGGRVNIGLYGNTPYASKSAPVQ
jgi:hypothetical protein